MARVTETPKGWTQNPTLDGYTCDRCSIFVSTFVVEAMARESKDPHDFHACAVDRLTDAQVRAEVDRRGMLDASTVPYGSPLSLSRENDSLRRMLADARGERDALKAKLNNAVQFDPAAPPSPGDSITVAGVKFVAMQEGSKNAKAFGLRGGKTVEMTSVLLRSVADDQLRAECERRGLTTGTLRPLADANDSLAADRDEWKRRAEAAEAKLTNPHQVLRVDTDEGDLVPLGHVQDCGRIEIIVTRVDNERVSADALRQYIAEHYAPAERCGGGIFCSQHTECVQAAIDAAGLRGANPWSDAAEAGRNMLRTGSYESGPGIERLPALEPAGTVDLATLADLLADDA
jgi:hypothetical protein